MKTFLLIFSLISALSLFALAQSSPQSIALSADEVAQAAAAKTAVEQAAAQRGQAWQLIQQTPTTDATRCVQAVAVAHEVEQRVALAEQQQTGLLWKHRSAHGCNECDYSSDGKALVKPAKP